MDISIQFQVIRQLKPTQHQLGRAVGNLQLEERYCSQ